MINFKLKKCSEAFNQRIVLPILIINSWRMCDSSVILSAQNLFWYQRKKTMKKDVDPDQIMQNIIKIYIILFALNTKHSVKKKKENTILNWKSLIGNGPI